MLSLFNAFRKPRNDLEGELRKLLGDERVLTSPEDLLVYEYDAGYDRAMPDLVVLPTSVSEVSQIMRIANRRNIPVVPRGAGTGLSGGTVPVNGGLVVNLCLMNRVLDIDLENEFAVVETGVVNLHLTSVLRQYGYHFAPDPSSYGCSTIGGNAAVNAGGIHCLKYGTTRNHVLGVETVLSDGSVRYFGRESCNRPFPDLTGLIVGSEGILGIITKLVVRITKLPEDYRTFMVTFDRLEDAVGAVSDIVGKGIVPCALELVGEGFMELMKSDPKSPVSISGKAMLIIEIDDPSGIIESAENEILSVCKQRSANQIWHAAKKQERERIWNIRRGFASLQGKLKPNYYTYDGAVPRSRLVEAVATINRIAESYNLLLLVSAHAGDGNLHPTIMFDANVPGERERAMQAGEEIMIVCLELGGTISGEHGIGFEKLSGMKHAFSNEDLSLMRTVKSVFDPHGALNPGKVLPESSMRKPISSGEMAGRSADFMNSDRDVFCPTTSAEVSKLLRLACDRGLKLAVSDSGRKGDKIDGVLNLKDMNRVTDFDPVNGTITVQAGMTLGQLKQYLELRGFEFLVSPLVSLERSMGALVACNTANYSDRVFECLRDTVLGMEVVLPTGELVRAGGKMVKDATGLDLSKLFMGSMGCLGIITELTLRLRRSAEGSATIVIAGDCAGKLVELRRVVRQAFDRSPEVDLFLYGAIAGSISGILPVDSPPNSRLNWICRYRGMNSEVDAITAQIEEYLGEWKERVSGTVIREDTAIWEVLGPALRDALDGSVSGTRDESGGQLTGVVASNGSGTGNYITRLYHLSSHTVSAFSTIVPHGPADDLNETGFGYVGDCLSGTSYLIAPRNGAQTLKEISDRLIRALFETTGIAEIARTLAIAKTADTKPELPFAAYRWLVKIERDNGLAAFLLSSDEVRLVNELKAALDPHRVLPEFPFA